MASFDTLRFARSLQNKAGMTQQQAEGLAEAFSEATKEQFASKDDVGNLLTLVRADLDGLYWKVGATVAGLLLANLAGTWGIVASYAG